jgi:hypothetical protein
MNPTERQRRILEWLKKILPHEGSLFESALHLWGHADLPCRAQLIAHAYRELCSGLANINGQSTRTDIYNLVDRVAQRMQELGPAPEATPTSGDDPRPAARESILVPRKMLEAVRELVDTRSAQPRGAARAQALFDRMHAREVRPDAEISASASRWHEMTGIFVTCCHDRDSDDAELIEILGTEVEFLEETLSSFAQGAVENLAVLDEILGQANT